MIISSRERIKQRTRRYCISNYFRDLILIPELRESFTSCSAEVVIIINLSFAILVPEDLLGCIVCMEALNTGYGHRKMTPY